MCPPSDPETCWSACSNLRTEGERDG